MNESERDSRLDAAWGAASREEPPPALDAAIRAAARRAVDAAPGGRRSKQWWYPVAAAATVALLAVGIAQLTPPERVAPVTIADDVPRQLPPNGPPPVVALQAPIAGPPAPPAASATGEQAPAKPASGTPAGGAARERARSAAAVRQEPALAAQSSVAPPVPPAGSATDRVTANSAPTSAPAPVATPAEPFPAAATVGSRRDAYREERRQAASPAAAARTEAAPSGALAAKTHADVAQATDASARGVEEWVKRIRDLKNEGRLDEAAKELALFRATYGEGADALLPADLREIKR